MRPLGVFQDQVVEQSAHTCLRASSGEERTAAGSSPVSALTCGNTFRRRPRRTLGELHRWLQVNGHDDRCQHMQPTDGGVQYGSEAESG